MVCLGGNTQLKSKLVRKIFIVGFPAFALQITTSIQQLVLNRRLGSYGADLAIAAIGIVMSLSSLLIMPIIGISQGAQPIIGYNYGAKHYKRVKTTLKMSIIAATATVTLGFAHVQIFPAQLVGMFNQNPDLIDLGSHALVIFFRFLPLVGLQVIGGSYFQAIGKAKQSTVVSLSRQVILFIPLLIILPIFWGLDGIWWSAPMADLGAFIITGIWLWIEMKSLDKE